MFALSEEKSDLTRYREMDRTQSMLFLASARASSFRGIKVLRVDRDMMGRSKRVG